MFVQETPQKRDKSFASPFQNWIFNAISGGGETSVGGLLGSQPDTPKNHVFADL